jgi:hypothetical protein
MTKIKLNKGAMYLSMYPDIAKRWINECTMCHFQGYKPEMPEMIGSDIYQTNIKNLLMGYFQPLNITEMGMCEQCNHAYRSGSK